MSSVIDPILTSSRRARRTRTALLWAAAVTLVLYAVPFGNWVLYPLMLLSTFVHEMGHGMAAVALGGDFLYFKLWSDGSGVAAFSGAFGAFGRAMTSGGGLLGPAILAAVLFLAGRHARTATAALTILAIVCVIADVMVVRNIFGFAYVAVLAAVLGFTARRAPPDVAQAAVVFLAIQLCASVFSRGDYLFTQMASTGGGLLPSDTEQIAQALGGPYWFWGAVVAAISLAVLGFGLTAFWRSLKT
ncbi:MAG: hypothetical protein ACI9DC_005065 [Gammaproteobacteria bacterium]|jgi:hypothetical protein